MNKPFEYLNTITAGIGMLLSIVGFIFIIIMGNIHGSHWNIFWCGVYGVTLMALHTSSTIYHASTSPSIKRKLRHLDQSCIYLLIAGTYTPVVLINLYGIFGWSLFVMIWGLFLMGVTLKITDVTPFKNYETYLYLAMGWLALIGIKPLYDNIDFMGFILIFLGGFFFTIGVLFYIWDNNKYFHAIWHLFVLLGSACHYFSILFYVIPYK